MDIVPNVKFMTRVRDDSIDGPNPYTWKTVTSHELFLGKRVVLFSLPGAFTPTCSTFQLPGFEENYDKIRSRSIDEVYCISVNDSFVMNAWAKSQGIEKVKVIPDGTGEFTRFMGMLVDKSHLGFGMRSWRYMCVCYKMVPSKECFMSPVSTTQAMMTIRMVRLRQNEWFNI